MQVDVNFVSHWNDQPRQGTVGTNLGQLLYPVRLLRKYVRTLGNPGAGVYLVTDAVLLLEGSVPNPR